MGQKKVTASLHQTGFVCDGLLLGRRKGLWFLFSGAIRSSSSSSSSSSHVNFHFCSEGPRPVVAAYGGAARVRGAEKPKQ